MITHQEPVPHAGDLGPAGRVLLLVLHLLHQRDKLVLGELLQVGRSGGGGCRSHSTLSSRHKTKRETNTKNTFKKN